MKYYILPFIISVLFTHRSNAQQNDTIKLIEYHASSRASIIQIKISSKQLVYNETVKEINNDQWKKINSMISSFDLNSIHNIEAPSNERFRDAAATAFFKIFIEDEVFESSSFDHENPPKEFSDFISEILKLAEL